MSTMKIQLDGQDILFEAKDLPMLISGAPGTGSSHFSTQLIYQLVKSGEKVLFFTALPAAKDEFKTLLSESELMDTEFVAEGEEVTGQRITVLLSGEEASCIDALRKLDDLNERIVFVKNMDRYSVELFALVKDVGQLVISGDIDETRYAQEMESMSFATKVYFSQPVSLPLKNFPHLERYSGYLIADSQSGIVRLVNTQ